jgi:peptidyl-tRNA hydrolase, PTH2 family
MNTDTIDNVQLSLEQRILYFLKNYRFQDAQLASEIANQFNITEEQSLEEIQKIRSKYSNVKNSTSISKQKPTNISINDVVSKIEVSSNSAPSTVIVSKPYVMYILVNADLGMGKGKTAGQVGHVVGIITEEIMRNVFTSPTPEALEDYNHYNNWVKNNAYTKVVLRSTEKNLLEFIEKEKKCRYILDAGRTQIAPGSLTVVGFFPRNDIADKFKQYKLLN